MIFCCGFFFAIFCLFNNCLTVVVALLSLKLFYCSIQIFFHCTRKFHWTFLAPCCSKFGVLMFSLLFLCTFICSFSFLFFFIFSIRKWARNPVLNANSLLYCSAGDPHHFGTPINIFCSHPFSVSHLIWAKQKWGKTKWKVRRRRRKTRTIHCLGTICFDFF